MTHRIGTWGDQGNGTFRNPILNADYPDVDIEYRDGRYYMISSTNHYAPGMTILESEDLVNWSIIGHVYETLDWHPKYGPDQMSGYPFGAFAGDLAWHDGLWYCYMIDTTLGLYVSTASDIHGPWSRPACMFAKSRWTDPAVYWDDDRHEAWLICNFGREPDGSSLENQIRVFRLSWDGLRLQDAGTVIYRAPGAEAAKLHKINGTYYVLLAEWRGNDRKQIVLRSSEGFLGPFERKVVMERREDLDRSTCQGSLIEAPDGSWWMSHQLVQHRELRDGDLAGPTTPKSYEGRSQWLVPVAWIDGWPIPGQVHEGVEFGVTVDAARKPVDGPPVSAPQTDDEFRVPTLGPQWAWNHNPRSEKWSLTARPDWLRLEASVPIGDGGFWNACNTLSQRIMGTGDGTAVALVDFSGAASGLRAGLCHHSGTYALLGISVRPDGTEELVVEIDGAVTDTISLPGRQIELRTDTDGSVATFSYRLPDDSWTRIGPTFDLTFGRWRGDRIGFYCWNTVSAVGHIDIDWFHYDYDGPKRSVTG